MAYCPRCRYEYREGVTHCSDCRGELLSGALPEKTGPTYADTEPVVLCRISDVHEAQLVCDALREERIPFSTQTSGPLRANLALVTDGQAPDDYTIIRVPQSQLTEAQQVLTALQSVPFNWPDGLEPEDQTS